MKIVHFVIIFKGNIRVERYSRRKPFFFTFFKENLRKNEFLRKNETTRKLILSCPHLFKLVN